MMTDNKYYVYLHIKSSDGTPFYVGKGKGDRCSYVHRRGSFWDNVVNKHGFEVLMLEDNLNETLAFDLECYWIDRIGRRDLGTGPLINLTGGGEGVRDYIFTDSHKERISKARLGMEFSDSHRDNIRKAKIGTTFSNEVNKKKGVPGGRHHYYGLTRSKEVKEKISLSKIKSNKRKPEGFQSGKNNGMFGKKHTKQSRDKMSETKSNMVNHNSKIIINLETGIFYESLTECSFANDIKYRTLLSGLNSNLTKYKKYKRL